MSDLGPLWPSCFFSFIPTAIISTFFSLIPTAIISVYILVYILYMLVVKKSYFISSFGIHMWPGRVAQSTGHLVSWVRYPVWPHTFASSSADSRGAVVKEVLVNRLGGLSHRKSVVRLTDHPDMTLDVYHGRKTTTQQQLHTCVCVCVCVCVYVCVCVCVCVCNCIHVFQFSYFFHVYYVEL